MRKTPAERQATYRKKHPERIAASKIAGKEKDAIWRKANKDHLSDWKRQWAYKNKEKVKKSAKESRERNKEKIQKRAMQYSKENREKLRKKARENYQKDPEKMLLIKRNWIEKNKEYYRARSAEYESVKRCKAKQATPSWANKFFMREIYHLAQLRTKCLGVKHSVDHIVPLQSKMVCGLHVQNNLRVIAAKANISKGNRLWPEMP